MTREELIDELGEEFSSSSGGMPRSTIEYIVLKAELRVLPDKIDNEYGEETQCRVWHEREEALRAFKKFEQEGA